MRAGTGEEITWVSSQVDVVGPRGTMFRGVQAPLEERVRKGIG